MTEQIGPYALGEVLAHTPFGTLYAATQAGRTGEVALLLMRPELSADVHFRGQIRSAARRAQSAAVTGLARLLEVEERDGSAYVVYERPLGDSLAARLAAGWTPTPREIIAPIQHLAAALDGAHRRGLVHGLVSPQTIFVGGRGVTTLVGVGLLQAVDDSWLGDELAPYVDLAYAAPEQSAANHRAASADGYALGAVVHTLLLGAPPANAVEDPTPPADTTEDEFAALIAVLRRQIADEPHERFPSEVAFATALAEALRSAAPPPAVDPAPSLPVAEPGEPSELNLALQPIPEPAPTPASRVVPPDAALERAQVPLRAKPPTPASATSERPISPQPVLRDLRRRTPPTTRSGVELGVREEQATPEMLQRLRNARSSTAADYLRTILGVGLIVFLLLTFYGPPDTIVSWAIYAAGCGAYLAAQLTGDRRKRVRLDADLREKRVVRVTGTAIVEQVQVGRRTEYRMTLADGKVLEISSSLYKYLSEQGLQDGEPGPVGSLIPESWRAHNRYRVQDLTVVYAPNSESIVGMSAPHGVTLPE